MSKLLLLFLVLVVRVVFTLVPDTDIDMWFPFDEHVVSLEFYIFQICEKFAWIIVLNMVVNEAIKYRFALSILYWLIIADLFDFVLTYNNEWFWLGALPVTLNNITALLFGLSIIQEFIWEKQHTS